MTFNLDFDFKALWWTANQYVESVVDDLEQTAQADMDEWHDSLVSALSKQLPASMWHKVREDRNALFPRMNRGILKNSISTSINRKFTPTGRHYLILKGNIGASHAVPTNYGIPAPKSAEEGSWVGWMEDVLFFRGRGNVGSVRQIFDKIQNLKRGAM